MNQISEKNYPIESRWLFKTMFSQAISATFFFLLYFFFFLSKNLDSMNYIYMIYYIVFFIFTFIFIYLRRKYFHYTLEANFLSTKEGVINRKQRNIPYAVIQHIFVKRDLLDRVFNLASLSIENASEGGRGAVVPNRKHETIGSSSNNINIPGLTVENAETLKTLILEKMKENPARELGM